MQRSFWSNWFKPATGTNRRWTLEELRELYEVLLRNGVVTEQNRAVVVETIRTIAEYILWGDQNEPRIFDFFLENNILTYLHKVLLQPSNRSGEVAKQVLQTLSIIIQNVRSETGIFFLFSNNHINNIVDLDFDFSDDEVLGYYVSFLKTISIKLNTGTVHFFLNSSSGGRGFPLYARAIRLAHNREGMVRAAVRTLTLNVYSVADPDIQQFVTSPPASHYFTEMAQYLAEQVQLLDRHLIAAEAGGSQALGALDSQLAETEDVLSYVSDLLSLGIPRISQLLSGSLWQWVVQPLLLRPLMQPGAAEAANAPLAGSGSIIHSTSSSRVATPTASALGSPAGVGHFRHFSWGSGSWTPDAAAKQPGRSSIRPACAVFVLERVFLLVSYQPLLQQLLLALACGATTPPSGDSSSSHPLADNHRAHTSSTSSSSCRACLFGMLSGSQPFPALLVLRLLVAIISNKYLPVELLTALSMQPRKQQQAAHSCSSSNSLEALVQALLQQVQLSAAVSGASGAPQRQGMANGLHAAGSLAPAAATAASDRPQQDALQIDLLMLLTEQYVQIQKADRTLTAAVIDGSSDSSSDGGSNRVLECLQLLDQWVASQQEADALHSSPAQPNSAAFSAFGQQLLSRLLPLMQLSSLPPMGWWLVGWLLHQLLPVSAVTGAAAAAASGGGSPAAAAASGEHHVHQDSADASSDLGSPGLSRSNSSTAGGSSEGEREDSSSGGVSNREGSRRHHRSSSADASGLRQPGSSFYGEHGSGPPVSTTRTASVQSSLGLEPRASVLNQEQQQQLQQALDAAHAGFAQQLSSMWCEAVFPLLALEWPAARDMLLWPVLRAGSNSLLSGSGAWPVLQALQQQHHQRQQQSQRQQQQQQGGWSEGVSASAQAALDCYLAVQRVVALTQIQELLRVGCIASSPPVPTVSEADLKQVDIQEGYQVDLAPGSALPCVVSFAPGQERRVYFAVAGLSKQQLAALQGGPGSTEATSAAAGAARHHSSNTGGAAAAAAAATAAGHASLLRSLPVALLADPSPSRPQAGVVLSVAPLLGAHPYTDPQVGKWLHVHVRPSVRGLLRIIKTAGAKKGGVLAAMRQLADGHWVLAFSSADKAALAVTLVQQHATRLQALYGDALTPLSQQPLQLLQQQQLSTQQQDAVQPLQQAQDEQLQLQNPGASMQPDQLGRGEQQQAQQVAPQQEQAPPDPAVVMGGADSVWVAAAESQQSGKEEGGQLAVQHLADYVAHAALLKDTQ